MIRTFQKLWAMWFVLFLWAFGSIICIGSVAHLNQSFPEGGFDSVIFDAIYQVCAAIMDVGTEMLIGLLISLVLYFLVWPLIKEPVKKYLARKRGEKKE